MNHKVAILLFLSLIAAENCVIGEVGSSNPLAQRRRGVGIKVGSAPGPQMTLSQMNAMKTAGKQQHAETKAQVPEANTMMKDQSLNLEVLGIGKVPEKTVATSPNANDDWKKLDQTQKHSKTSSKPMIENAMRVEKLKTDAAAPNPIIKDRKAEQRSAKVKQDMQNRFGTGPMLKLGPVKDSALRDTFSSKLKLRGAQPALEYLLPRMSGSKPEVIEELLGMLTSGQLNARDERHLRLLDKVLFMLHDKDITSRIIALPKIDLGPIKMPLKNGRIVEIPLIRLAEHWELDDLAKQLSNSPQYIEVCRRAWETDAETGINNAYAQNLLDYMKDTQHVALQHRNLK